MEEKRGGKGKWCRCEEGIGTVTREVGKKGGENRTYKREKPNHKKKEMGGWALDWGKKGRVAYSPTIRVKEGEGVRKRSGAYREKDQASPVQECKNKITAWFPYKG